MLISRAAGGRTNKLSESEVLKSTGSLPVAILEMGISARPAHVSDLVVVPDRSVPLFSGTAWRSDLGAPTSQEAKTPTGAPGATPLRVPTDLLRRVTGGGTRLNEPITGKSLLKIEREVCPTRQGHHNFYTARWLTPQGVAKSRFWRPHLGSARPPRAGPESILGVF